MHFVKVTFCPVSEDEIELMLDDDERLTELFPDPSVVEYDGYERGSDDLELYFYGENAETMVLLISPELKKFPCADRATVLKVYGMDDDAQAEIIALN
jgi:hypothetical protein